MAEEKKAPSGKNGTVDRAFDKLLGYLSHQISSFVSFLFLLIALGGFYGYFIIARYEHLAVYLLIAPLALALIAYYNRTFATIIFVMLLFFVFLL